MEKKQVMTSRMHRFAIVVGVLILLAAFTVLITGTLNSGEANAKAECSLKTLNGTFVFEGKGVFIDGEGEEATVISYAESGFQTFDGDGNFEGVFSASNNGEPLASQEYFTGTYRHEGDCVFTNFAPVGGEVLEFHLYLTREGTYMSYFGPGVSGTAVKP